MREAGGRFWAVAYTIACVMAGTNIASPLFSTYQHRFGFSPFVLTAVFTVYVAVIVPGLLGFGSLADAIGRRPVLAIAVLAALAGSVAFAIAPGVGWLIAGRIAEGIGFAAAIGTGTAALVELHPRGDRRFAAAVATASFLGGAAAGPLLTGVLAEYFPWPLQLAFAVHAALLLAALGLLLRMPEPLAAAGRARWRPGRLEVPAGAGQVFALLGTGAAAAGTCGAIYLGLASSFAGDLLHTRNLAVVGVLVAIFLVAGAAVQTGGVRLSIPASALLGLAAVAAGDATGVAAVAARSVLLLAIASALAGAGQGLTFRGTLAPVLELAPPAARAGVTSTYWAIVYAAAGVASLAIGGLAGGRPLATVLPAAAAALGGVAIIAGGLLVLTRRRWAAVQLG